jgi:phosphatidate cytidylyltransferase
MRERAVSAAVLVPVLLGVVLLGGVWLAVAVALATAIAAVEVFRLLRAAGWPSLPILGTVLALAVVLDAAASYAPDGPPALIPEGSGLLLGAIGLILAAVGAFSRPDPRDGFATWVGTVFGAVYVALLAFVLRLGAAAPEIPPGAVLETLGPARAWILLLVGGVWSFDTGAYLVGRRFGRRRFLAHISPAKTVEGVIGGLVAATVVSAVLLVLVGREPIGALLLGPLVGGAAQAGDLAESLLKRAAGAKASGRLIPGHGGMLDRIDSFLFAAPAVTLYVVTIGR